MESTKTMHEQNIETIRSEAQRLIEMEVKLLQKMLDEPGVLAAGQKGQIQTFDRDSTLKHIEVLQGERTKLTDLEMVLAVVGTMKAGKSTSINAIVGTEVLPNRNRPMTALPTLIRHTPGQTEPLLKFDNNEPIQRLMNTLRNELIKPKNREALDGLKSDPDMQGLITLIECNGQYKQIYRGADAIFKFLKGLNDLVRLSRDLGVEFPFSDYDEIHEMPVIEVEFVHLRETSKTQGRLTLLDTPGPNESGQPHLRKMLREQLGKASAVLAILDFTQLKSDADAEVRKELQEIAEVSKGRLYTLVNKFDQKDRHGDSKDEVKVFVAEQLMSGQIRPEDVFPVSSRWGYLANRARHEVFVHNALPDPEANPWVVDFGEEAFGRRWENKINDPEEVKAAADVLWKDSLFHAPLESVIQTAHARAAGLAIDAAAAKLVDLAVKMDNLLATRETALTKSAKVLQEQISALQQDISRVATSEAKAHKGAEKLLKDLTDGSNQVFGKVQKEARESLDVYFKEGKRIEREKHELALLKQQRRTDSDIKNQGLKGILSSFLASASGTLRQKDSDFDPTDPVMKFSDRSDATELLGKIETSVTEVVGSAENAMKAAMDVVINAFQKEFSGGVLTEARAIVEEMKERLQDQGFSLHLAPPSVSRLSLNFSGSAMLSEIIDEKTKSVTRSRRKSGAWGTVCRWFGTSDWGWEDYESSEAYFEVDIRKIQKATMSQIGAAFDGLDQAVALYVKKPLNDGINDFFDGFKKTVEQIRGDLLQSVRDQERSQAEQADLARRLNALRKNVPDILGDTRALKQDVEPLVAVGA